MTDSVVEVATPGNEIHLADTKLPSQVVNGELEIAGSSIMLTECAESFEQSRKMISNGFRDDLDDAGSTDFDVSDVDETFHLQLSDDDEDTNMSVQDQDMCLKLPLKDENNGGGLSKSSKASVNGFSGLNGVVTNTKLGNRALKKKEMSPTFDNEPANDKSIENASAVIKSIDAILNTEQVNFSKENDTEVSRSETETDTNEDMDATSTKEIAVSNQFTEISEKNSSAEKRGSKIEIDPCSLTSTETIIEESTSTELELCFDISKTGLDNSTTIDNQNIISNVPIKPCIPNKDRGPSEILSSDNKENVAFNINNSELNSSDQLDLTITDVGSVSESVPTLEKTSISVSSTPSEEIENVSFNGTIPFETTPVSKVIETINSPSLTTELNNGGETIDDEVPAIVTVAASMETNISQDLQAKDKKSSVKENTEIEPKLKDCEIVNSVLENIELPTVDPGVDNSDSAFVVKEEKKDSATIEENPTNSTAETKSMSDVKISDELKEETLENSDISKTGSGSSTNNKRHRDFETMDNDSKRLKTGIVKRPLQDATDEVVEKKTKASEIEETPSLLDGNTTNMLPDTTTVKESINATREKIILKMLPLLFENEPIPAVNIEEIILAKIIEAITQRSEMASLRQQAQKQEQTIDQYRKKITTLTKQMEDINTVLNRLSLELQNRDRNVMPVRITRSVGLQVTMSTSGNRFSCPLPAGNPPKLVKPTPPKIVPAVPPAPQKTSLLSKALTQKSDNRKSNNTNSSYTPEASKTPTPAKSPTTPTTKTPTAGGTEKPVIDLTDEDLDQSKTTTTTVLSQASNITPLTPTPVNNIRVVPVSTGAVTVTPAVQQSRVTYLMTTPTVGTQNTRQVLIATPTGTRPVAPGTIRPQRIVIQNGIIPPISQTVVPKPGLILTNGTQQPSTPRLPIRPTTITSRNSTPSKPTTTTTQLVTTVNSGAPIQSTEPATQTPTLNGHPAPLPIMLNQPHSPGWKQIPPRPALKIGRAKDGGIQLSWSLPELDSKIHEIIVSYQLYAYQESTAPPCTELWRKVGDIKALPLPMACTLTSFSPGNKYYFAVRAIDANSRVSQFSYAQPIILRP